MYFLGFYLVQAIGYMSLALLIGHLVRKSGLAGSLLVYAWVLEPILQPARLDRQVFPDEGFWQPGHPSRAGDAGNADRPHGPLPGAGGVPAFAYSLLFCLLAYVLLRVRDL